MININSLKLHIKKKEENIIKILEYVDCHSATIRTTSKGKEVRFALPDHKNATSGVVSVDTLLCSSFTPTLDFGGDLISFVGFIKNINYSDAALECCKALGICLNDFIEAVPIYTNGNETPFGQSIIECHKRAMKGYVDVRDIDLESFPINKFSHYIFAPHYDLLQEGIGVEIQKKFSIGFDVRTKRILFPHRFWNLESDEFVGIFGRTTNPLYEELGIPKYWGLKGYPKKTNLYGLWENLKEIRPKDLPENQEKTYRTIHNNHYIIIYEAEKSVLKRATRNDFTGVAMMGHSLSDEQISIINQLEDVHEVIFALDKDVSEEDVKRMCERIITKRTSYMIDKNNLLGPKDAPCDCGEKVFWTLYSNRIKVCNMI